jgi:hypothetical protein
LQLYSNYLFVDRPLILSNGTRCMIIPPFLCPLPPSLAATRRVQRGRGF